jgi:hypothetical protein
MPIRREATACRNIHTDATAAAQRCNPDASPRRCSWHLRKNLDALRTQDKEALTHNLRVCLRYILKDVHHMKK